MDMQNQNQNDELALAKNDDLEIDESAQDELSEDAELNNYIAAETEQSVSPEIEVEVRERQETEEDSEKGAAAEAGEAIAGSKFLIIKEIIENIKNELTRIGEILGNSVTEEELGDLSRKLITKSAKKEAAGQMKVVEGVFDGQNMIGGDGEHYTVPANYASKSKLVEGDLLKLTILHDGSFVYKQIAPIERRRIVGVLAYDESSDQHYVLAESKRWKVLRASITYFKGEPGDEITIVVPKDTPSQWGAVENIIKK